MDINLKNITSEDGLELAKQILSNYPEQKIVILSGYNLPVYHNEAKKIGAKGFINKNTEPEMLIAFLSQIMQGKVFDKCGNTMSVGYCYKHWKISNESVL